MCKLSIIVPVLNEQDTIKACLSRLQYLRKAGHEIIVVDGGSQDNTLSIASSLSDFLIKSKKSRSIQMNAGANKASGDFLIFLHVDTILPARIHDLISQIYDRNIKWGRFDLTLSGQHFFFRVIEKCINIRSRLTGIATGDQVIFVEKEVFNEINGFPEIALMEDIAISKSLLKYSKPACLKEKVVSSSRRWEKNGILKTILKMWVLRLLYFFHYDTNRLEKIYS
ncbi:MAG: glycosyltransferase family 2 protein [Proteobacteria bacterium]|nr:glycosyltransferase [Pseudomonadota bacterium]NOG58909.1 glycosyltransferase family 2 protein [Pseudomonadota bacterium]